MATAAYLPIVADRAGACVRTIRFVGIDLTGVTLRLEVRLRPDTPGTALVALTIASAGSEGLSLSGVATTSGVPTSSVQIRIAEATMKDNAKVPYMGELGDAAVLAYDLIATIAGDKRRLTFGEFVALATVNGADGAPASRPSGSGAGGRAWSTWSGADVTLSGDSATVSIDGIEFLLPIVAAAQAQATQAAISAASAARSDADATAQVATLAALDPTTSAYAATQWVERLKTMLAATYVDHVTGDDTRSAGTYLLPVKTTARANALASSLIPAAMLARGQRHPTRLADYTGIAPNIFDSGSDPLGPLIDTRQDLSAKTWTLLSGSTTTWETTAVLGVPLNASGIDVANGSKFVLYRDHYNEDPDPTGASLRWITKGANVAANDTAIKAAPGSWGINLSGSTTGDIRNDVSGSTAVRIVVHLADGSNPNSQPIRLLDGKAYYVTGGSYGHLRIIAGGSKDNISFAPDTSGVTPTFQSIEMIDAVCHGGVGERNVVGLCKIIARPVEGEAAAAGGRTTQGGGYHLFTPAARPNTSIFCGSVHIENTGGPAIYGHVAGTRGYGGSFTLARGGTIKNCAVLYGAAGSSVAGLGFFETAVNINGQITATDMGDGYLVDDVPVFRVNGVRGNRSTFVAKGGAERSTLILVVGWHPNVLVAHLDMDFSAINFGAPDYAFSTLIGYGSIYGTGTDPANPTLRPTVELRDVHDLSTASHKAGVYGAEVDAPGNFDVNLVLTEGTTLGDLWRFPNYDTYPRSLVCDGSAITIGIGGKTRAQVRTAMAALGRTCTLPDTVTMVDRTGAVADAPA